MDQQPAGLEWSFNPWRNRSGPPWRRPWVALLVSLAVCALFGVALAYPNIPDSSLAQLERYAADQSLAPEARDKAAADLEQLLDMQEHWGWQAAGWGGVAFVLLLGMTAMLYLPVRYRLDEQGVTVFFLGVPNTRKWDYYRNYYPHDTGVHLTTMPRPSGFDPFRGHFVQFSGNRDEVVEYIRSHMKLRGIEDGTRAKQ